MHRMSLGKFISIKISFNSDVNLREKSVHIQELFNGVSQLISSHISKPYRLHFYYCSISIFDVLFGLVFHILVGCNKPSRHKVTRSLIMKKVR